MDTSARRADLRTALLTFVGGLVTLQVGLVGLTPDLGLLTPVEPRPWWRVALLGAGCLLILAKRTHPLLALAGGVSVTLVDLAWGGSLAILLVLWDLLYAAALWSSRRARTALWTTAAVLSVAGAVVAGEATRSLQVFVFAGIQLGAILLVPMWWADNVRQKTELAELERARADEAARAAELERRRAADLDRLATARRHEAVQAERAAMARDLHDVVASHLSSIALHAGAALAGTPDTRRDREALDQVRHSAVESLTEMRSMIELLRADAPRDPVSAPERMDRLDRLVETARSWGHEVLVDDPDRLADEPWPTAVSQAMHRIVQEALTNVRKHAPGSAVRLTLRRSADGPLRLEVVNALSATTTQPLAPEVLSAGDGLLTMRERAEALGGTFSAVPTSTGPEHDPQDRWVVRVELPLHDRTVA
ncbi:histidine kinase [Isoptericola halotolerans]|uniref:histidine kinase n=1 Tax=Isoptericola halotolerans TaxID=300560 RepID=A0ABX1ZYV2_9MICO|nr:signal transduction histidine kinase [Isoptericola halotolerans]